MKILAAIFWIGILIGSCAGCASTLTPDEEYERADREVLRLEAFYRYEQQCEANGGMVEVTRRTWTPRRCAWQACPPNRSDGIKCVSR